MASSPSESHTERREVTAPPHDERGSSAPVRPVPGTGFVAAAVDVLEWKAIVTLALALLLGLGAWELIGVISGPIALLIAGITIAEALTPIVQVLNRWVPRTLAITIVYIALLIVLGLIGWLVVPRLIDQTIEFLNQAPTLLNNLQNRYGNLAGVSTQDLVDTLSNQASSSASSLATLPLMLAQGIFDILVIIFMSVYWLIVSPSLKRFVLSLIPEEKRSRAEDLLGEMGSAVGGYVRGATIDAVVMGTLAGIGLWIIGIHYPIVLGLLTMLGELVPVIGPIIVAIPIVLVALLQSPTDALFALGLYVALEQFEGHILTPNIMHRQTHASQLTVIFALAAGAAIGGILWALVAIPLAGALRVLVVRVIAPWLREWSGAARNSSEPAPSD